MNPAGVLAASALVNLALLARYLYRAPLNAAWQYWPLISMLCFPGLLIVLAVHFWRLR